MYFTFHYVSILIPKGHEVHSLCFHFTFHYVSILIGEYASYVHGGYTLYIPLCLYFNIPVRSLLLRGCLPLHSIMSLF